MPKFVIERELAGAGKLTPQELQGISATSNKVLHDMTSEGKDVQSGGELRHRGQAVLCLQCG